MMLPLSKLQVDEYQRGEAKTSFTIDKAKNFNFAAAGAIVVGRRDDGTYWIVDGLQRYLAELKRGDIKNIDCMVFDSEGKKHEAEIFLLCNSTGRINVNANVKFRTSVIAEREPYLSIDRWLASNNFKIDDKQNKNCIGFPANLVQIWEQNPDCAKRGLFFVRDVGDGSLSSDIFKGATYLIRKGINVENYKTKIIRHGGVAALQKEINALSIVTGKSKNWTICASGILKIINKSMKKRIEFDD